MLLVQKDSKKKKIAMTGASFCKAAEDAFFLSLRNIVRLGAVRGLGTIFTFAGEVFITGTVSFISYSIFTRSPYFASNLFNPVVPTMVIHF